jgi:hypothetical protein
MAQAAGGGRRLSDEMADLLAAMAADDGTGGLSPRSAAACVRVLGVSGVGVTASAGGKDGAPETVWRSGALVAPLGDLEFTVGEGPGVDATSGILTLEPDLTDEVRWPGYAPAAQQLGACAVFGFPVRIGAISLGAFTAYRTTPGPLSDQQLVDALVFADALAMLLLDPARHTIDQQPRWLAGHSMGGRAQIHQATGMISVQLAIGLAEALVRLRAYAYGNDQPIETVAAEVVAHRLRFDLHR